MKTSNEKFTYKKFQNLLNELRLTHTSNRLNINITQTNKLNQ